MEDREKLAEAKVGLFVVAALVVLVAGTLWITGLSPFGRSRVAYLVLMKDSGGVKPGDAVRLAGVEVGRVRDVGLRPGEEWPVQLQVLLDARVPLREDAGARLSTSGLLGSNFLLISPGSPGAPLLPPGGEIRGEPSPSLSEVLARVDEISGKAISMVDKTAGILDQISRELGPILKQAESFLSEKNAEDFQRTLQATRRLLETSEPRLTVLMTRLDSISRSLDEGLTGMPGLTGKISTLTDDLHAAFGPGGARLSSTLDAAQSSLKAAGGTLELISGDRAGLETALGDLQETASNLKSLSRLLKERPFSLIRIKPEPDRRPGQGLEGDGR